GVEIEELRDPLHRGHRRLVHELASLPRARIIALHADPGYLTWTWPRTGVRGERRPCRRETRAEPKQMGPPLDPGLQLGGGWRRARAGGGARRLRARRSLSPLSP